MELEEQKPKITLLDREIKQETIHFLENLKEEPIEEDEYSEPIIPKQETEESLENVKTEANDDDYSKHLVQKLEEIIETETSTSEESRQSVQKNIRTRRNRHCYVCFQRYCLMSCARKEDRLVNMIACVLRGSYTLDQARLIMSKNRIIYICHHHFSESLNEIYKILNIGNPEEIASCSVELKENLMTTVNSIYPHITTSQFCAIVYGIALKNSKRKQTNFKTVGGPDKMDGDSFCAVCSLSKNSQYTKRIILENDKLIIMMGCVLRGDWNLDQAKLFIAHRSQVQVCHIHLSDAFHEIFKFLDIKKTEEIASCSVELMQNLMNTVNSICRRVDSTQFRAILYGFVRRNTSQKRKRPNTEEDQNQKKREQKFRCTICSQIQFRTRLKQVTVECEKLIILIGYILRGDYTIEEVKQFLYMKKPYLMICHAHLVEANNEILKVLQVNNPGGILSCSSELMEKLMVTVNAIDPEITIPSFQKDLRNFAMRNKQHLGIND